MPIWVLFRLMLIGLFFMNGCSTPIGLSSQKDLPSTPFKDEDLISKENDGNKETFGAEANPTGDPIGGGKGYGRHVSMAHYRVKNIGELLAALKEAKAGQIIYIDDAAEINLSGLQKAIIPAGVSLASGRGRGDSLGALLFSNQLETSPLFRVGGENVHIIGLRLRGPDSDLRKEQMMKLLDEGNYYSIPNSDGIESSYPGFEVDNCELWGWSRAAISLKPGAKAHIHHNFIHHCRRYALGYGVCLDEAYALIEANLFDWCRHHIAGTGRRGTAYEARYNLVLQNDATSHSFDMHGGYERGDGTDIAGEWINIHHNTFQATKVSAVVIRGKPFKKAEVHHNWFFHKDPHIAVQQRNAVGNMIVYRNQYTLDKVIKD